MTAALVVEAVTVGRYLYVRPRQGTHVVHANRSPPRLVRKLLTCLTKSLVCAALHPWYVLFCVFFLLTGCDLR
jgi:hypothetical protein